MTSQKKSVIVRIAGAAGDGIASSGELLGKVCSRQGLHVMAYNAFQSAVRGGHVWLQLNIGSEKTLTHGEETDVLVLLNKTSPPVHVPQVKKGGIVFYNSSLITEDLTKIRDDVEFRSFSFKDIAKEPGITPIMENVMLVGCVLQVLGLDPKSGMDYIAGRYVKKGEEVVKTNQRVLQMGMDWAEENAKSLNISLKGDGKTRMFVNGNTVFGMGLITHGLKFYAAYPMSPSTGILHYIATKAKSHKILVKQTEDELASVNFCVGAAHAGVRTATATSGGGFSLMVEGVGLAAMLEEPIVVINVQRGSPSTGIPTKQEQADLSMMVGGSQGDSPRIILGPKDINDAFETAGRALNLAEKYQMPVIILSDFFLSEHFETLEPITDSVPIERGKIVNTAQDNYKRYLVTEDGVSPRMIPGTPKGMYVSASDEHDESGEVISDVLAGLPSSLEVRNKMHPKRMRKLEVARNEDMRAPIVTGIKNAEFTLLGWGSTYNAIEEACQYLNQEGIKVNHIHFQDLYPMPKEAVLEVLESQGEIILVENNYSYQLARLILAETGFDIKRRVNRYDGEPFTGEDIAKRVKNELFPSKVREELAHV